jgi:hypothetical protein
MVYLEAADFSEIMKAAYSENFFCPLKLIEEIFVCSK